MKRKHIVYAIAAVVLPSTWLLAQQATHEIKMADAKLYPPAEIQWKDGPPSLPPGAKISVLEGDPTKEGMFLMRVRLPDGFHVPAHTHPKPERLTVIQGTFKLAMGDNPKKADARILPAGTYGTWPPGMVHAAWIEGDTIIQLHGTGPWAINYVNPADDPRNSKK
jgi:quercetin dioxygenase-like cupin family protein